jgi:hypothetical protein
VRKRRIQHLKFSSFRFHKEICGLNCRSIGLVAYEVIIRHPEASRASPVPVLQVSTRMLDR